LVHFLHNIGHSSESWNLSRTAGMIRRLRDLALADDQGKALPTAVAPGTS